MARDGTSSSSSGPLRRRMNAAAAAWRSAGPAGVAYLAAKRLTPSRAVHLEWFVVLESVNDGTPRLLDPGGDIRWATPADIGALARLGRTTEELRSRLDEGDAAALLAVGGEVVGYAWFRRGRWDERGIQFVLGEGDVWGYDAVIAQHRRGRREWRRLAVAASGDWAARGVPRVISGVDRLNRSGLRAAAARGSRAVGTIASVRVLGLSMRRERWRDGGRRWRVYRGSSAVVLPPSHATWAARPRDGHGTPTTRVLPRIP